MKPLTASLLLLTTTLLPSPILAQQAPQYHPFTPAIPQTAATPTTLTATTTPFTTTTPQPNNDPYNFEFELLKRQNNYCASGYTNCAYLAAANVCCSTNALCTNDANGRVACCPQGAVCTGTVAGGGAIATGAVVLTSTGTTSVTAGQTGFIQGSGVVTTSTAANGGIVVVSGNGNSGGQVASGGGGQVKIKDSLWGGLAVVGGLIGMI